MLALAANPPSPLAEKKLTLHDSDGRSIMFMKTQLEWNNRPSFDATLSVVEHE